LGKTMEVPDRGEQIVFPLNNTIKKFGKKIFGH
jgi:hypothetical protein